MAPQTPSTPPEVQGPDALEAFIQARGIQARLIRDVGDTPTVPAAAQALGVPTERIVKTLLFLVQGPGPAHADPQPVVVISHGERRVDRRPLAAHFQVGRKRIQLAPPRLVVAWLGYPAGGVPPFGHRTPCPVVMDASLARLEGTVYAGGGDDRTMMAVDVAELIRVLSPTILELSPPSTA